MQASSSALQGGLALRVLNPLRASCSLIFGPRPLLHTSWRRRMTTKGGLGNTAPSALNQLSVIGVPFAGGQPRCTFFAPKIAPLACLVLTMWDPLHIGGVEQGPGVLREGRVIEVCAGKSSASFTLVFRFSLCRAMVFGPVPIVFKSSAF